MTSNAIYYKCALGLALAARIRITSASWLLTTTSLRAVIGGSGYAESRDRRPAWVAMWFLEQQVPYNRTE
eukprot:6213807-Pleurochrysis_carterae.AAC.6